MISALLLQSLIVDAENEENNENKMEKIRKKESYVSWKRKRRRRGEIKEPFTGIKLKASKIRNFAKKKNILDKEEKLLRVCAISALPWVAYDFWQLIDLNKLVKFSTS